MRIAAPESAHLRLGARSDEQNERDIGIEGGFIEKRDIEDERPVPAQVVGEDLVEYGPAHGGVDDGVQDGAVALSGGAAAEDAAAEGGAVEGSLGCLCWGGVGGGLVCGLWLWL